MQTSETYVTFPLHVSFDSNHPVVGVTQTPLLIRG